MAKYFECSTDYPIVETKAGLVRGFQLDSTIQFYGIKYADAKRFEMPEPVKPWEGVFDAHSYGHVCPMLRDDNPSGELFVPHRFWPTSEHCQYLNIWTQTLDPDAKLPVMVWLHGGGFEAGSSIEQVCYDGTNLSQHGDVVVVSLNHRLNILGYLDVSVLDEKYYNSANVGTADMVMALRWIQENIVGFGGDPDNVTLFGQSGGGGKICALLQTPEANGLFHKGIIQSGVADGLFDVQRPGSPELCYAILEELGITKEEGKKLAEIPYRELAAAYNKVRPSIKAKKLYEGDWPAPGKYYLGDCREIGFTEHAKTIPLIIGSTYAEFNFRMPVTDKYELADEDIFPLLEKKFGSGFMELAEAYRETWPDKPLADLLNTDHMCRPGTIDFVRKKAACGGAPIWSYIFAYDFPHDGGHAAWHCADLPFCFHNTDKVPICNEPGVSDKLEEQVSTAWLNFAKYGDPNATCLPKWPAATVETEYPMIFDEVCTVRPNFDHSFVPLLQKLTPKFVFHATEEPVQR